jgi:hypothetical protein
LDLQLDVVTARTAKAIDLDFDVIDTWQKVRKDVQTGAVGLLRHRRTRLRVGDRHRRPDQHASSGVGDHSADLAKRLGKRCHGRRKEYAEQEEREKSAHGNRSCVGLLRPPER